MSDPDNPFASPQADDLGPPSPTDQVEFPWFLVGTNKLMLMTVLTFGLYSIHWFERQYRFQKRALDESTWPLARGLFSIFFAHELFRRIDAAAEDYEVAKAWTVSKIGGVYVGALVLNRVVDRVTRDVMEPVALSLIAVGGLALVGVAAWSLSQAQATLNQMAERARTTMDRNEGLTIWNWLIVAFFGALILLGAFGNFLLD